MNIMDILRLDAAEIDREKEEILETLRGVGLSEYESRSYLALVMHGPSNADDIAEIGSIPRTSVYKVLNALKDKGFATIRDGRPTIYVPSSPQEVKERTIGKIEKNFYKLDLLQGVLSEKGTPQLVYTIVGKEKVVVKIGEMLESSRYYFLISSPALREINSSIASKFRDAIKRGVKVTVVAEPNAKVPEASQVLRRSDLIATDVIADGESAMIAAPDLSLCGFSDNPFLAAHLENFINVALGRAER